MSGKEIINGMDQVIQYIQNQDKKIKELQEKNGGLEKRLQDAEHEAEEWEDSNNEKVEEIDKLKKEIKELQEKNEKLCNPNEDGVDYSDVCEYLEYDPNEVIANLKDEYKRFKATIIMHLGGKEVVGGQYPDDIKLRDITEVIEALRNPKQTVDPETGEVIGEEVGIDNGGEVVMSEAGVLLYEETRKENKELKEIIKKMSFNRCVPQSIIEDWVVGDQIDPHLLIGNADECYKKVEGKWTEIISELGPDNTGLPDNL